jgi:hypothetical protein
VGLTILGPELREQNRKEEACGSGGKMNARHHRTLSPIRTIDRLPASRGPPCHRMYYALGRAGEYIGSILWDLKDVNMNADRSTNLCITSHWLRDQCRCLYCRQIIPKIQIQCSQTKDHTGRSIKALRRMVSSLSLQR